MIFSAEILSTGCSWTDKKSGTRHVLVLGIGVVSINDSKPQAATIASTQALGITADRFGFNLGYSDTFYTTITTNVGIIQIKSSARPCQPITIEVQNGMSKLTNQIQKTESQYDLQDKRFEFTAKTNN